MQQGPEETPNGIKSIGVVDLAQKADISRSAIEEKRQKKDMNVNIFAGREYKAEEVCINGGKAIL